MNKKSVFKNNTDDRFSEYAHKSISDIYLEFGSSPEGMPGWQVEKNRAKFGVNRIFGKERVKWYVFLLGSVKNPFNFILFVLAGVSIITKDITGALIIIVMVLLSISIKFWQELKSARTEESLKKMVNTKAFVLRIDPDDNLHFKFQEIPLEEIVPGDIIHLSAGDMIPADVRLISSKTLFINESMLTGESLPIEKKENAFESIESGNETRPDNICFLGSNVVTGSAEAIVIATGKQTYLGAITRGISTVRPPTAFDIGVTKVSWLLIRLMLIVSPIVFFINGFTKGSWLEALMFGLSVAVGLTPEMLPVVVTTNLVKGAVRMSNRKVIVRNLNSIQDIGAMNILCTDKTGTLTENHIALIKHLDIENNDSGIVLTYAFLNSYFQSGLQNLMDEAVINSPKIENIQVLKSAYKKIDEIPFDFERRRMSVVIEAPDKSHLLICKGALNEILSQCRYVTWRGKVHEITENHRSIVENLAADLNEDGMRVILVAHKNIPSDHGYSYEVNDETDLILDGVITFLDPPKLSATEALKELRDNQIFVKLLTGDNEVIARKVCKEVGFPDLRVVTGNELAVLNRTEFKRIVSEYSIFARLTPLQKDEIVLSLKEDKNVVGYMGDGINDAAALNSADVGISVDGAVDIARENADFILLEQDLTILNSGVEEGRKTYANMIKYIKCTSSSNFGNVFSLVGASALFPFLPMLPIQILVLNLLYDFSQTILPWDNVDKEFLKTPHTWKVNNITRFILIIGPLSSIFDYCTFALLYYFYHADSLSTQGFFQTGWFIESLFTQTFIVQLLRTPKIPFIQSIASRPVLLGAFILLVIGLIIPYTWFGHTIGMVHLPFSFYGWLLLIVLLYSCLVQLVKTLYIRRYKDWL